MWSFGGGSGKQGPLPGQRGEGTGKDKGPGGVFDQTILPSSLASRLRKTSPGENGCPFEKSLLLNLSRLFITGQVTSASLQELNSRHAACSECPCVPGQNDLAPRAGVFLGASGPSCGCRGRDVSVGGLEVRGGRSPWGSVSWSRLGARPPPHRDKRHVP